MIADLESTQGLDIRPLPLPQAALDCLAPRVRRASYVEAAAIVAQPLALAA